jgi:hypothetical protein
MVIKELRELATQTEGANVLDFNQEICPGGQCQAVTEDAIVIFRGRNHLTDSFVRSLIPTQRAKLINLLIEGN